MKRKINVNNNMDRIFLKFIPMLERREKSNYIGIKLYFMLHISKLNQINFVYFALVLIKSNKKRKERRFYDRREFRK